MKLPFKKYVVVLLCVCTLLSGCSLWMDGEYAYIAPNNPEGEYRQDGEIVASNFEQLHNAVIDLVEAGIQTDVIYIAGISDEQLVSYIEKVIQRVLTSNPIGAYAVEKINYELGANLGKNAVALEITYNHNRSEILQIKEAKNMNEVLGLIRLALINCDASTVLRVDGYEEKDFTQFVEDYVLYYPQTCMEMPVVSVSVYPDSGEQRVIEIFFTYQTSRETLRAMQQSVSDVFKSARYYVDEEADNMEKSSQLYSFLMERYSYNEESALTPAYSLLRHGVGDSRAFASVYSAMCRQVSVECSTISGTKAGEPWHWNAIKLDGVYYYIDLLECKANDGFILKTEEEMEGYVWDYPTP